MGLVTYPLNNVDYSAEDAELFHCTRSSGVYAKDDFECSATGADTTVAIGTGIGWIRNSKFSGKVIALKEAMTLDLGLPDSVYPRIDAVVIRFDANKNSTDIVVKQGAAASSPVAPEVSRTEALYELHLYHIRREAGEATVAISNIKDRRLDENYCGLMGDSVTIISADHSHDDKYYTEVEIDSILRSYATTNALQEASAAASGAASAASDAWTTASSALTKANAALPKTGGTMTGAIRSCGIVLKEGVDCGTAFPKNPVENQLFFLYEEET